MEIGKDKRQISGQTSVDKKQVRLKRRNRLFLILGLLLMLGGILAMGYACMGEFFEDDMPVAFGSVTEEEEYCMMSVQYMSEAVASFDMNANRQFYIAFDRDGKSAILCMGDREAERYQPYREWLYSNTYDELPEIVQVSGYSAGIDEELKAYVIRGMQIIYGKGYVDKSNFEQVFGQYYINMGPKESAFFPSTMGIILLILGLFTAALAWVSIKRNEREKTGASPYYTETDAGKVHRVRGILGAVGGALLGGILWTLVTTQGYVSGWIGVLIIYFAITGYRLFAKTSDKFGTILSVVLGFITIWPATLAGAAWSYYILVNKSISGYVNYFDIILGLPDYLTRNNEWPIVIRSVLTGYVFAGIASLYFLFGMRGSKNKEDKERLQADIMKKAAQGIQKTEMTEVEQNEKEV